MPILSGKIQGHYYKVIIIDVVYTAVMMMIIIVPFRTRDHVLSLISAITVTIILLVLVMCTLVL